MPTIRVATFNVHHCEGLDGRVDVERTARVIERTRADLVALQELDRGMERSGEIDQPAELERLTGLSVTFHATLQRGGGEYGIAIAARGGGPFGFKRLPQVADEEPRGYHVGPFRDVTFLGAHLSLRPPARARQTSAVIAGLRAFGGPFVLLGDLNQSSWALRRASGGAFRVPSFPRRTMARRWAQRDHIVAGRGARVVTRDVIATTASDHYALVADVASP
ncbi:MAG: endonuclease/exonuclease/phosphatase family protein [Actinobacteria bacterium]|nr:endonuclease/exonuclease/phosphatase family protein [Actinomycetota bacterium]